MKQKKHLFLQIYLLKYSVMGELGREIPSAEDAYHNAKLKNKKETGV